MSPDIEDLDPIIRDHVLYAMGAGLIPIPMIDVAAVTAVQLDMIRQLCKKNGVDFNETQGKAWVAALTGSTLSRLAAGVVKLIPGVGTILGGVTMSILSGASTYAVGRVAEESLQKNGSIFEMDFAKAKKRYDEAFEQGKEVAETLKKEAEAKKNAPASEDVFTTLEKLGKLKESGVITEEEFEAKKKDLLSRI
jgi:uncharacterized protein (DUF697 family)